MATATRKSSKATVVTHNLVGQAETFLQDLPEKPKQDLSLREAIGKLQEPLQAALAKGYNYEELAQLLSVHGIRISPLTLKNYVPSGRRRAATAAKSRRPKTADDAVTSKAAPADSETTVSAIADESAPATIKPRRGRTKAALSATGTEEATPAPAETTPDRQPKKRSTRTRQTTQPSNRPTVARRRKSAGV